MYHRVYQVAQISNAFETHLRFLSDHYPLVLPGDDLPSSELAICLTFDDATVDFYHLVFPLLQKFSKQAILAIPTAWVADHIAVPIQERLALQEMAAKHYQTSTSAGLCSWEEIYQMHTSGYVHCAAHGHQHLNMSALPSANIIQELEYSKSILHQKLGQLPTTYVYPYGRTNHKVQSQVTQYYPYAMRIGAAVNANWAGNKGLLYRVDAEKYFFNSSLYYT
ncbi:hypothetical protein TI05_16670 [Achromatium sp. WMS3]|nr:hypothetical protein TI05_16670 [Achromatium sp. WMS3]